MFRVIEIFVGYTAKSNHSLYDMRKSRLQLISFGAETVTSQFMTTLKVKGEISYKIDYLLLFPYIQYKFPQMYFISYDYNNLNARCVISIGVKRSSIILSSRTSRKNNFVHFLKPPVSNYTGVPNPNSSCMIDIKCPESCNISIQDSFNKQ